ncbi:hypothetical protein GGX14DRAFT_399393 [Mycena pura]|uniref:Uncharacterized protein n=1 Tax=Mycena pura TaxID=153505 RepID=A0AAD6Y6X9_9AGAR|nr:hypothetical protein GGX14DRAFT_399393 [Mycena pura]
MFAAGGLFVLSGLTSASFARDDDAAAADAGLLLAGLLLFPTTTTAAVPSSTTTATASTASPSLLSRTPTDNTSTSTSIATAAAAVALYYHYWAFIVAVIVPVIFGVQVLRRRFGRTSLLNRRRTPSCTPTPPPSDTMGVRRPFSQIQSTDPEHLELPSKKSKVQRPRVPKAAGVHVYRFPAAQLNADGTRMVAALDIGSKDKSELQATCKAYGISFGSAMSRGDLIGLLKAYSDAGDWTNLQAQAHRMHKGQQPGSVKTKVTLRRDELLASGSISAPPALVSTLLPADIALAPEQSEEQAKFILDYVDQVVFDNPVLPASEREPPVKQNEGEWRQEVMQLMTTNNSILQYLAQRLPPTAHNPEPGYYYYSTSAPMGPSAVQRGNAPTPTWAAPSFAGPVMKTPSVHELRHQQHPAILPTSTTSVATCTPEESRQRGPIAPDLSAIPAPPADGFFSLEAKDTIATIARHWNKTWPEWRPDSNWIKTQGAFIQLIDYPRLYHGTHWWGRIKNNYSQWLALMSEYEKAGSESLFWTKYTRGDGTKMKVKEIIAEVRSDRKAEAAQIRERHGPHFDKLFTTVGKDGVPRVMTDAASIIARQSLLTTSRLK